MIRHPSTLNKIKHHCRSAATAAAKPRASDAISYLDKWKPRAGSSTHESPLPEGSASPQPFPKAKVWSRPQQSIQSSPTPAETVASPHLPEGSASPRPFPKAKVWSRPQLSIQSSPTPAETVASPHLPEGSASPQPFPKAKVLSLPQHAIQSSPTPAETVPSLHLPEGSASPRPFPKAKVWSRPQQSIQSSPTPAETVPSPHLLEGSASPQPFPKAKVWSRPQQSIQSSPTPAETVPSPHLPEGSASPRPCPKAKVWSRPQQSIQSSPTPAETVPSPHGEIRTAPLPEALKKWSQPLAAPPGSSSSQISILDSKPQPSSPAIHQKVSQPTSLSLESNLANQYLEEPSLLGEIRTAPLPEALKKWSQPLAAPPRSNSSQISMLDSNPQPSSPAKHQKVSQPTSLSSDPDLANRSLEEPSLLGEVRTAPFPAALKKWSQPLAAPSRRNSSQIPMLDSNPQPSSPAKHQKVSQPTSLSSDSDLANRSLEEPSLLGEVRTAPFPAALKKWSQPLVAPSRSNSSRIPMLDSNPQPSSPAKHQKVSQPTSLSLESDLTNQSLEEPSLLGSPETPRSQEFNSFDTDPDEFDDKPLRPQAQHRSNNKDYFEGRGRFERVSSKVLLQQSANSPLSKKNKKASPVPKLIKARRMDIFIPPTLSVAALAKLLNVKLERLQQQMRRAGMESESSYDYILTSDYAVLLAEEFGRNPIVDEEAAFDIHSPVTHPNPSSLPSRPPIVTIMGHVDHGKTTLLDTLRSASVAKGEAGGITQHIGAFSVPVSNNETGSGPQSITFLDTPGHAAFSAMRARGANVTDIIVLVVAADDGVMPQTKEVINLFRRDDSQVSLVVAINKIDKPNVDLDTVKRALMVEGIQVEDFGGDIPCVHVSGLTGEGLPELLETLSLIAEMQDLRAENTGSVYGHVLESNVQKGLGPVATILIRRGCLKVGMHILSGLSQAKVRRMNDSNGKVVPMALPGMAVTVSGWKILPKAGDDVLDGSENDVKKAISNRTRRQELEGLHQDVDAINSRRREHRDLRTSGDDEAPLPPVSSGPLELKLIIKADVSGSAEAVRDALHGIGNTSASAQVISTGVGEITESDVMMAKVANATIVGFSVTASRSIRNNAAQNGVPICTSNIIYRLVDDVRERVTALLPVVVETKVTGEATILQLFDINLKQKQTMKIAGCRVTNGLVEKQKFARIIRNGNIVYDGNLTTMRQLKKDITEARKGTECGLGFGEFGDLEAGDLIQSYEKIERPGVI